MALAITFIAHKIYSTFLLGPPENNRDHIMAAAKAIATGNWREATKFISGIKVWDYLLVHKDSVISMLDL